MYRAIGKNAFGNEPRHQFKDDLFKQFIDNTQNMPKNSLIYEFITYYWYHIIYLKAFTINKDYLNNLYNIKC